jgi:hypothetical protein
MKKLIKKWGANVGVLFSKEEQKILGIEEDDVIDISDVIVEKRRKSGKVKGKR